MSSPHDTASDPPASDPPAPMFLVPTAMERDRLQSAFAASAAVTASDSQFAVPTIRLCGFGIAASAAMTMHHLHQHRASHLILAGIAGSLAAECEIGSAYWFSHVISDGIGVGEGASFESAAAMGWKQLDEVTSVNEPATESSAGSSIGRGINDCIELNIPNAARYRVTPNGRSLALVTGCAGASDPEMAAMRIRRAKRMLTLPPTARVDAGDTPIIAAEDMEGFGVAIACRIMNVRLSIVRGISNRAGDRNHAGWQIETAMAAVANEIANHCITTRSPRPSKSDAT